MKVLFYLILFLLCGGPVYSQECGKVASGIRGGSFNIYYEQRFLIKAVNEIEDLPENVRLELNFYLNRKHGNRFAKKLKFDSGRYLDLNRLKQEFPNLYESNLNSGAYELLFYFSDKDNGLKYFYAKLVLNEDGSVNQEINLPNIAESPDKEKIIPCKKAAEIAEKNGFPIEFQSQWFQYNARLKTFVWEIHDRRQIGPDQSLMSLIGKGTYYVIEINANTGEVLRKYKSMVLV